MSRRYDKLRDSISSGTIDETKTISKNSVLIGVPPGYLSSTDAGLLDQWLYEGKFTEEEALSQSFDMLSAGIDTVSAMAMHTTFRFSGPVVLFQTSSTANFLLYELAKQPELQERLVQEVLLAVGEKNHPSWDDLQKMTLLRNCVKEVMRLYVPTGGTARTVAEDVVVLGYQVPAGVS